MPLLITAVLCQQLGVSLDETVSERDLDDLFWVFGCESSAVRPPLFYFVHAFLDSFPQCFTCSCPLNRFVVRSWSPSRWGNGPKGSWEVLWRGRANTSHIQSSTGLAGQLLTFITMCSSTKTPSKQLAFKKRILKITLLTGQKMWPPLSWVRSAFQILQNLDELLKTELWKMKTFHTGVVRCWELEMCHSRWEFIAFRQ